MVEYLGSTKFGGMYCNNNSVKIPQMPYDTDKNMFNGSGLGDIHSFVKEGEELTWNLGNTPKEEEKIIQWNKFRYKDRNIYVCDRVLLNNISYNEIKNLYKDEYVFIDGKKFMHRLITEEEWLNFIATEEKIAGVPFLNVDFTKIDKTVRNMNHNLFWNWIGIYTFVQTDKQVKCYGYSNPKNFIEVQDAYKSGFVGLRPILEEVYGYAIIEGKDGKLGEFENPFIYDYSTVTYIDNDRLNVVEKLNDTVLREYTTDKSVNNETIDLTNHWENLPIGIHKINIEATNKNGEITTKTAQFTTPTATFVNKEGLDYFTQKFWNEKIKPFVTELSKRAGGLVLDSNENFTGVGVKENTNLADNGVCVKATVDSTVKTLAKFSTNVLKLGNHGLLIRISSDKIVSGGSFSIIVTKKVGDVSTQLSKKEVQCSEFTQANKYQNFYTTFEYQDGKQSGETIEIEVQTANNANTHVIKLDYVLISQMLPAVFL